MRRLLAVTLLLAGCGFGSHTISGTFTLVDSNTAFSSTGTGPCHGTGGYADVQEGMDVVVKDGAGKVIGKSSLIFATGSRFLEKCVFAFAVTNIPSADFYLVSVGRRGEMTFSKSELIAQNWTVDFSLGEK